MQIGRFLALNVFLRGKPLDFVSGLLKEIVDLRVLLWKTVLSSFFATFVLTWICLSAGLVGEFFGNDFVGSFKALLKGPLRVMVYFF